MIIYKDIVTGDEIISDTYKLIEKDDVVYEVECRKVTKGAETFDIGANPSAEEADEGVDDTTEQVIDVVDSFRYGSLGGAFGTKKDFMGQFKSYLKKVVEKFKEAGKSEEEIKAFQTKVQGYFSKEISPKFKDFDFYTGESMDPEGMVVLLNYREDGVTPYVVIWKDALTQMKV